MNPLVNKDRAGMLRARHATYSEKRALDDALEQADCVESWLQELGRSTLGHEGDHAVDQALQSLRVVRRFLRRLQRIA